MAGELLEQIVIGAALHGVLTAVLLAWSRWVARRHPRPWWQKQVRLPWLALAFAIAGAVIGAVLLARTWRAIGVEEAAHKATRLAEGISASMHWGSLFTIVGWLLYAMTIAICIVGTIRAPSTLPTMAITAPSGRSRARRS